MSITKYREQYKPFKLQRAWDYYKVVEQTYWRPELVPMTKDVQDFNLKISPREREAIAGILKGFTILECYIGDYWMDRVTKEIPLHEVKAACYSNALMEVVHADAYSHLTDTLGLADYKAFLNDPVTRKKIDYFVNHPNGRVSLAVFSGAGEGVSLFSSFAILLSFGSEGKFKGLSDIISWSIRDENNHSNFGCYLFTELVKEKPLTEEEKNQIYDGFQAVVQNEISFIDQIFNGEDLPTIKYSDVADFIMYRANDRLKALTLEEYFPVTGNYKNIQSWFALEYKGQVSNDFFTHQNEGGNYSSSLAQDFSNFDYSVFKNYSKRDRIKAV